jgi:A/G-specific adenine glycosylase
MPVRNPAPQDAGIAGRLLAWYDAHHRDLPWRVPPRDLARGVRPDPYRVWLSEVMLQQTTVEAVKSYFSTFVRKWPTVTALASAPSDDIMKAWAGLGYYSRARNLKACADQVAALGGTFPDTEDGRAPCPASAPTPPPRSPPSPSTGLPPSSTAMSNGW